MEKESNLAMSGKSYLNGHTDEFHWPNTGTIWHNLPMGMAGDQYGLTYDSFGRPQKPTTAIPSANDFQKVGELWEPEVYIVDRITGVPTRKQRKTDTSLRKKKQKTHLGPSTLKRRTSIDSVRWSDFTDNTTFHGIRYIFSPSFKVRKLLWAAFVVTSIVYFVFQVGQRTSDYFAYNSNIDVDVMYVEELKFPAVTICNQNNFRLSATTEYGKQDLYYFIDDVYSAHDITDLDLSMYNVDEVDSLDFITFTAHQLHDLVDHCTWNQKPCDLDKDFITTITEVGVCYTFNSGVNSTTRMVTEPGSAYGLSLTLNIEQYEYMKGPNNDAGVKIRLHEQNAYPLMKDWGFAAPPGTHTIVGIMTSTVRRMPPPYGKCDMTVESIEKSHCLHHCRIEAVIDKCKCVDVYMQNDSYNHCNIKELFQCARTPAALSQIKCQCAVPCEVTTYEPSFSYAQLSQFNVERMTLLNSEKQKIVEKKFAKALEYSHRRDEDFLNFNENQLQSMHESLDKLNEMINEAYNGLSSESNFQRTYDIPLQIINGDEQFTMEIKNIENIREAQVAYIEHMILNGMKFDVNYVEQYRKTAFLPSLAYSASSIWYNALHMFNDTTALTSRISPCETDDLIITTEEPLSTIEIVDENVFYITDQPQPTQDSDSIQIGPTCATPETMVLSETCLLGTCFHLPPSYMTKTCDELWTLTKSRALYEYKTLLTNIESDATKYEEFRQAYSDLIFQLYNNTHMNPSQFENHRLCESHLDAADIFIEEMRYVADSLQELASCNDVNSLIDTAEELESFIRNSSIHTFAHVTEYTIKNQCAWLQNFTSYIYDGDCHSTNEDKDVQKCSDFLSNLEDMKSTYRLFEVSFINMGQFINKMQTTNVVPALKTIIENYKSGNITKMELARKLTSLVKTQQFDYIAGYGTDFFSTSLESIKEAEIIKERLQDAYTNLFAFTIPVYNITSYLQTRFIRQVIALKSNGTADILAELPGNITWATDMLFEHLFMSYAEVVRDMRQVLNKRVADFVDASEEINEYLEEYIDLGQMNDQFYMQNFLQVDLFFKELSYEEIEQQPSFSFPSLLSEVGGFLGLFLGASILTMCELLDFIGMAICTKCRNQNRL